MSLLFVIQKRDLYEFLNYDGAVTDLENESCRKEY